jgi:tetratricopeptide (TPR) repeat protein
MLLRNQSPSKATEYFQEALEIRSGDAAANLQDLSCTMYNLALCHHALHNYPKAVSFYHDALQIQRQVLSNRHADVAVTLYRLGQAYQASDNMDMSLQYLLESLDIEPQAIGRARIFSLLGTIFVARNEVEVAMECFERASRLLQDEGLPIDSLMQDHHQVMHLVAKEMEDSHCAAVA